MKIRNKKKTFLVLIISILLIVSLVACGKTPVSEPIDSKEMTGEAKNKETDVSNASEEETREIIDLAGRKVRIPVEINKVFPVGPVAAIYVYTLNPDKLSGWNYELNQQELKYVLPEYQDIPVFGMGESINYEAVIKADPDIAITVSELNEASIAEADKLSESLGIPVIIVADSLENTAPIYDFLGNILGEEGRAMRLAAYADKTFSDIESADIPEDKKVTVYFGNGVDSLQTAPKGSSHAQIFDLVGAINVADLDTKSGGRVQVSLEQLLAWNPQYMIVNGEPKQNLTGDAASKEILENPDFASIQAVQDERVFSSPKAPFSWVDRPSGPNRIIGIRWLSTKLYPEYFTYDIDEEVKEFFKLYYHTDLTEEALSELYHD